MDWLEEELKQAMARKEPAPDFDSRVRRRLVRTMPRAVQRWFAAAAALIVIAGGGGALYRRHQGEQAKEQIMLAMRIAGSKLNRVQAHVQSTGERQ
jgi:uridylate kinase